MLRTKVLYAASALVLAILIIHLIILARNYGTLSDVLGALIVIIVNIAFFSRYFLSDVSHFSPTSKQFRYGSIVLFEIIVFLVSLYIIKSRFVYYLTSSSIFVLNSLILIRFVKKIRKIDRSEMLQLFEDLVRQPVSKAFAYLFVLTPLIAIIILALKELGVSLSEPDVTVIIALTGSILLTLFLGLKLRQCDIDVLQFGIVGILISLIQSSIPELRKLRKELWTLGARRRVSMLILYLIAVVGIVLIVAVGIMLAIVVAIVLYLIYSALYSIYSALRLNPIISWLTVTVSIVLSVFIPFFYELVLLYRNPQDILGLTTKDPLSLFAVMIVLLTIFTHAPLACSIHKGQ